VAANRLNPTFIVVLIATLPGAFPGLGSADLTVKDYPNKKTPLSGVFLV
jgi:hypothetical protein